LSARDEFFTSEIISVAQLGLPGLSVPDEMEETGLREAHYGTRLKLSAQHNCGEFADWFSKQEGNHRSDP
jgi:hypothetical protein